MASDPAFDRVAAAEKFRFVFETLYAVFDDGAFRRLKLPEERYIGPFLLAAFEVIALGVALNYDAVDMHGDQWLKTTVKQLWAEDSIVKSIGQSSSRRLSQTLPLARDVFK